MTLKYNKRITKTDLIRIKWKTLFTLSIRYICYYFHAFVSWLQASKWRYTYYRVFLIFALYVYVSILCNFVHSICFRITFFYWPPNYDSDLFLYTYICQYLWGVFILCRFIELSRNYVHLGCFIVALTGRLKIQQI